jgi:hypothetical protein
MKLFLEKIRSDGNERKKLDLDLKKLIRYLDHQYHIVSSLFGHANSVDVQLSAFSQRVHIPYRDSELLKNSRATISHLIRGINHQVIDCKIIEKELIVIEQNMEKVPLHLFSGLPLKPN